MANLEFFLKHWEREFPTFTKVFKALPKDKLDFRPHPRSRSAAELVWLLVYGKRACLELTNTGKVNLKETPPPLNLDEIIATYEGVHTELGTRLKKLDDKTWEEKKVQVFADGQVYEETLSGMFWGILFDAIHHRGQLSVYIRLMGGKVPSVYGPSADDPGA